MIIEDAPAGMHAGEIQHLLEITAVEVQVGAPLVAGINDGLAFATERATTGESAVQAKGVGILAFSGVNSHVGIKVAFSGPVPPELPVALRRGLFGLLP